MQSTFYYFFKPKLCLTSVCKLQMYRQQPPITSILPDHVNVLRHFYIQQMYFQLEIIAVFADMLPFAKTYFHQKPEKSLQKYTFIKTREKIDQSWELLFMADFHHSCASLIILLQDVIWISCFNLVTTHTFTHNIYKISIQQIV